MVTQLVSLLHNGHALNGKFNTREDSVAVQEACRRSWNEHRIEDCRLPGQYFPTWRLVCLLSLPWCSDIVTVKFCCIKLD